MNMLLGPTKHPHLSLVSSSIVIFLLSIANPAASKAQLNEVSEFELAQISAQSGITYVIGDSRLLISTNSYKFSDTDSTPHNWIEFNNITVDDGSGGYFSMDTPETYEDFNRMDVATDDSGLTAVFMNLSLNVEPRTYTVGNFVFCNQDIGSLRLESLRTSPSNAFIVSARNDGSSGINFEYQTELMLDSARFIYNTSPASLSLNGFHLSQTAGGDPADPSSWTYSGKFKLGDWAGSNPATIDVATIDYTDGTKATSVFYNIPMSGSMRVQSVDFGGNNFGPCAIDGIKVHHLGIQMPGK